MRTDRVVTLSLFVLAGAAAPPAGAQDSPLGIRGLGMPGRLESARTRGTGGAFAAFDQLSALNDASIAGTSRLTATATGAASYLTDAVHGASGSRRTGRLPIFQVIGNAGHGLVLGVGFTTYLDRSYRVTVVDTIPLGGSRQEVTDNIASDGGVTDVRFVAARRWGRVSVGAGLHLMTGSARAEASRIFTDTSAYQSITESEEIAYHGRGYSLGAVVSLNDRLAVSGFWRTDTRLRSEVSGAVVAENDLPQTLGAAVRWQPAPAVGFAASVVHRTWATATDSNAYNTTSWSAGGEVRVGAFPLRLGARGGDLPFGPRGAAPREFAVAAGSGLGLSHGRGVFDFAVERLRRTATGLTETGWTVLVGITLRP